MLVTSKWKQRRTAVKPVKGKKILAIVNKYTDFCYCNLFPANKDANRTVIYVIHQTHTFSQNLQKTFTALCFKLAPCVALKPCSSMQKSFLRSSSPFLLHRPPTKVPGHCFLQIHLRVHPISLLHSIKADLRLPIRNHRVRRMTSRAKRRQGITNQIIVKKQGRFLCRFKRRLRFMFA